MLEAEFHKSSEIPVTVETEMVEKIKCSGERGVTRTLRSDKSWKVLYFIRSKTGINRRVQCTGAISSHFNI